jgi:hypothetical protein
VKIRYVGPEPEVLLSIAGASIVCPRRRWLDPEQASLDAHVPVEHVQIVVGGLDRSLWEIDDKPAKKPRGRKAATPTFEPEQPPAADPQPTDEPGEQPADQE